MSSRARARTIAEQTDRREGDLIAAAVLSLVARIHEDTRPTFTTEAA